jgi:hypothetical protein
VCKNVAQIIEVYVETINNESYINVVMELALYGSLKQYMRNKDKLTEEQVRKIAI